MRTKLLTLFALTALLFTTRAMAGGGPDAYGYVWLASTDAGGPAFNWVDISTSGSQVSGLSDDNSVGMFNIGFNFHYYWGDFNSIKVGSNGWIAFDNVSNIAHCFPTIPAAGGNADNYLAPFMADLNFNGTTNPGRVYTWTNNVDTFIISYVNSPFWVNAIPDFSGSNTFQVILSGVDSSITFNYLNMDPTFNNNTGCASDNVVGIENSTGAIGLQVSQEVMPPDSFSVKFYYPDSVLINVPDLAANWNQNIKSAGVFVPTGITQLTANIRNAGNVGITSSSTVNATLTNALSQNVYTSNNTLASLAQGADTTYQFSPTATLNTAGYYDFQVTVTNSGDINAGNNGLSSEIVVVDLSSPTATLTYATGAASSGSVSWSGGGSDDGAGVYMEPPTYPVNIASVEYYLTAVTSGMIATIYDDNGPNGSPGTLLWSDTLAPTSLNTSQWNTVNVSSTLTINSGGFYIGWYQNGAGTSLGTETAGPRCRRNYEILGGAWAEWRENQNQDLLIKANISGFNCSPNAGFTNSHTGNVANFSNTTSGASSYLWSFGDGSTDTVPNPTHTYSAAGTYTVCLIASNICGADTTCDTVQVSCPIPSPGFTSTSTGITFNFSNASSGASSYLWDFGDGSTSTQTNPTHTYAAPGTYTVCLTTTNVCGTDSTCQSVTACFLPTANFLNTTSGTTVSFTSVSSSATSLTWNFGDGNTSTQVNPSHTYASGGVYNVCLIASNPCGADTFCRNITVSCTPPTSGFTFSVNNSQVSFTSTATSTSGGIQLHTWDFGDGNASSSVNPTHTYAAAGTYTVCLTVTDSCTTDSVCQSVTVCPTPQPSFTFSATGLQVMFNNTSSVNGIPAYFWEFGDGTTSPVPNPVHNYASNGNYTVCLTASDNCGNDSTCQVINVTVVGLEIPAARNWQVFPNPARDLVQITGTGFESGNYELNILDLRGKKLKTLQTEALSGNLQTRFHTDDLARGVYLLEIRNAGMREVRKLILE